MALNSFFKKIGIIIPFFAIFLMSQNTFAATYPLASGRVYRAWSQVNGSTWQYRQNYTDFVQADYPVNVLRSDTDWSRVLKGVRVVGNPTQGSSSYTVNSITNIIYQFRQQNGDCWNDGHSSSSINTTDYVPTLRLISGNDVLSSQSYASYDCQEEIAGNGYILHNFYFSGFSTTDSTAINGLDFRWGDAMNVPTTQLGGIAGVGTTTEVSDRDWAGTMVFMGAAYDYSVSNDPNAVYQGTIINQNNTIINQNNTQIEQNQQIIDHNDKEEQAADDIENQTPPTGTDNQQTTNLIGVLSNFLAQLQNFRATDCNVVLPFPSFIGGNMTVNICQNKDKAGDLISIIGSLIMVGFYIPLAIVLLRMIYNEIRSFTNG